MLNIIRENRVFFVFYAVFLLISSFFLLKMPQGDEIIFFSNHRNFFENIFFSLWTHVGEPYLYVPVYLFFLWKNRRASHYVLGILIVVGLASWFTKDLYDADRPYRFFMLRGTWNQLNLVEGIDLNMGNNSFPSGHTMSAFAVYGLAAFLSQNKKIVAFLFCFAAILVGISRIYLVQHFLRDVWAGSLLGLYLACAAYTIFRERLH